MGFIAVDLGEKQQKDAIHEKAGAGKHVNLVQQLSVYLSPPLSTFRLLRKRP